MARSTTLLSKRLALPVCAVGIIALAAPVASTASATTASGRHHGPTQKVLKSGLDNPRQLSATSDGNLLVAQAGHGSDDPADCVGSGEDTQCIGLTGKATKVFRNGRSINLMRNMLSAAGPDGSFATGSNGASQYKRGKPVYAVTSYAPPEQFPEGIPSEQAGKLLVRKPWGPLRIAANITRFEERYDPDGEGFDSNPYSVLALKDKVLVADAAGDSILSVKGSKVRLFHRLEYKNPAFDPVPTVLAKDARSGNILVGELHSEIPGEARVWSLNKHGKAVRSWSGFTTVTGVARAKDGTLYVSELFGGSCGFDQIPTCFPGQVTKVSPSGKRTSIAVPFPAGIVADRGKVHVVAFSTSPTTGFGGNPAWSGQIWRIFR